MLALCFELPFHEPRHPFVMTFRTRTITATASAARQATDPNPSSFPSPSQTSYAGARSYAVTPNQHRSQITPTILFNT